MDDGNLKKPMAKAEKDFFFYKGKIGVECGMNKEVFYHGQEIPINISIRNGASRSVKLIELVIWQHCELTMIAKGKAL